MLVYGNNPAYVSAGQAEARAGDKTSDETTQETTDLALLIRPIMATTAAAMKNELVNRRKHLSVSS